MASNGIESETFHGQIGRALTNERIGLRVDVHAAKTIFTITSYEDHPHPDRWRVLVPTSTAEDVTEGKSKWYSKNKPLDKKSLDALAKKIRAGLTGPHSSATMERFTPEAQTQIDSALDRLHIDIAFKPLR